jgi:lipopolysaccharide/colanic/teichoic acid biosynthesis glycosyltransferase
MKPTGCDPGRLVIEKLANYVRLFVRQSATSGNGVQDLGTFSVPEVSQLPERNENRRYRRFVLMIKRVLDVIGSTLFILMFSPIFLAVGLLIFATDGPPIIYRRRVVGPRGSFDAYKFRTMIRDADAKLALDPEMQRAYKEQFKLKSDPRVTPFGGWLRKYSLDELPQFVNVLKGQMSLVGPRMITAPELDKYDIHKKLLLTVKPGLTGYWQIKGRQDVSYAERVRMDVHYITNWSLTLDLLILMKTPARIIFGRGAY